MAKKTRQVTAIDRLVAIGLTRRKKEQHVSLRALEDLTGIPKTRISLYLRGNRAFVFTELHQLSIALGSEAWRIVKEAEESLLADAQPDQWLPVDATQSDYELVAKPLSPDTAAAVKYWDTLGEEPQ